LINANYIEVYVVKRHFHQYFKGPGWLNGLGSWIT